MYGSVEPRFWSWLKSKQTDPEIRQEQKKQAEPEPGNQGSCPECGNSLLQVQDGTGDVICSVCGLVVDRELQPPAVESSLFSQYAPAHPLLWNRNLGSDEKQLLSQLKNALKLKISSSDLRTDDGYLRDGLAMLAGKLRQHNLDYGETAKIARALRRRLRQLTSKEKIESIVNEVYYSFFPSIKKQTLPVEIGLEKEEDS